MTTPVGDIRLDLTIDGSGLTGELTSKILGAIKPALADLRRSLEHTERDYRDVGRESEKSATKQSAAARVVAASLDEIGDQHRRNGFAAQASASVQVASLSRVRREVRGLTADYLALASAQSAAAVAPGPPGRGGGGGGGGGFRGGGRFTSGPLGAAVFNAGALGVGSWPAIATAATQLTGGLQQLTQVGLVAPGVIAGIGASMTTAVIGFQGMADAVEALNEAAASGDPKDLEKVAEQLKDMAPSAVETAKAFSRFTQGPWKDLQRSAAQPMFDGIAAEIDTLAEKQMPTLMRGTAEVGSAWNKTFKEIGRVGGLDSSQNILDKIFGNTAEAQTRANAAIEPLIHGMGTLTAEGTDFLPRLADGLTAVTTRFDNWITRSVQNGNLDKWIDRGLTGMTQLGESTLNLGKVITNLTKAAGADEGGFLAWLESATTQLAEFTGSAEGQERLTSFFREGREQLAAWGGVLRELGPILKDVYEASKQWTAIMLPALTAVLDAVNSLPGGLEAVVIGFLAFKTISPFTGLLGGLTTLNTQLTTATTKATGLQRAFGAGGLGRQAVGLAGLPLLGAGLAASNDGPNPLGLLGAVGGGAATGFAVGGPWGSLIGGFAAAIASITTTIISERDRLQSNRSIRETPQFSPSVDAAPATSGPLAGTVAPSNPALIPPVRPGGAPTAGGLILPGMPLPAGEVSPPMTPLAQSAPGLRQMLTDLAAAKNLVVETATEVGVLGGEIRDLPNGNVEIDSNSQELRDELVRLGFSVKDIKGKITIDVAYRDARGNVVDPSSIGIGNAYGITAPRIPGGGGGGSGGWSGGRADGGVLPGYSPGVDNLLWPMSGGEGVVIPEAMRALGSGWLYNLNSRFRGGLSRQGYADGGVVGGLLPPTMVGDPVVGLLTQIRDLLAGDSSGPLSTTADAISTTSGVGGMNSFGTSRGASNPGYEMAAAAISALGGDPSKFLGPDPATLAPQQVIRAGAVGAVPSGGGGMGSAADALIALAQRSDGASYAPASDLANGLADCSGAISDLVEVYTTGTTSPDRLFTTHNAGEVLKSLGAVPGLVPGALQVGINPEHMAATLPNGVNFESGGSGGGVRYGRGAAGAMDPQFTEQWSLPVGGALGGAFGSALGGVASDMCACVGDSMSGLGQLAGDAIGAVGDPLRQGARNGLDALLDVGGRPLPDDPASLNQLISERNPAALASLLGYQVGDHTRAGGGLSAQDLLRNDGPAFQADGRMFSDTSALVDRTFSSLQAVMQAQHEQMLDVTSQVRDQLTEQLLGPILESGVTAGIDGLSSATSSSIGQAMGQAAAPPIADAVRSAVATSGGGGGGGDPGEFGAAAPAAPPAQVFDEGGIWPTHTPAWNLSGMSERVLNPAETRLFDAGLLGGWNLQPLQQHMATTSGVDITDVVGAEFFGVSQIPIIGVIVNALVSILLRLVGIELEARDTLQEMTGEVRQFRGEFQGFDAVGRIMSDTSALIERTSSSEEAATDERVRMLKLVISEVIKYIIQQFWIPITKAVANTAIQAGASAAGAAINTQAPGAGGIVSSLISSAGMAGVDIGTQVWSQAVDAITPVATDLVGDLIETLLPNVVGGLFSGRWLSDLFTPLTNLLSGAWGGLSTLLGAGIGAAADMSFDSGGMAYGKGLMVKDVIKPERVLNPRETVEYNSIPAAIERLARVSRSEGRNVHVYVTQQFMGGQDAGRDAADNIMELVGRSG